MCPYRIQCFCSAMPISIVKFWAVHLSITYLTSPNLNAGTQSPRPRLGTLTRRQQPECKAVLWLACMTPDAIPNDLDVLSDSRTTSRNSDSMACKRHLIIENHVVLHTAVSSRKKVPARFVTSNNGKSTCDTNAQPCIRDEQSTGHLYDSRMNVLAP